MPPPCRRRAATARPIGGKLCSPASMPGRRVGGGIDAGGVEQGGADVLELYERVALLAARDAGSGEDHRHADAGVVVHVALSAEPVVAEHFAVIGEEHQQRAVAPPRVLERGADAPELLVEVGDVGEVASANRSAPLRVVAGEHGVPALGVVRVAGPGGGDRVGDFRRVDAFEAGGGRVEGAVGLDVADLGEQRLAGVGFREEARRVARDPLGLSELGGEGQGVVSGVAVGTASEVQSNRSRISTMRSRRFSRRGPYAANSGMEVGQMVASAASKCSARGARRGPSRATRRRAGLR